MVPLSVRCCSYLASKQIVSLYNVCDLLLLAYQCEASQLVRMCLHNVKVQFSLLRETTEYNALPEELKGMITGDHDSGFG